MFCLTLILTLLTNAHAARPARRPAPRPPVARPTTPRVVVYREAPAPARYNLRFNPLGLLIGTFDLGFDVGIARSWTLGPVLRYASASGDFDDVASEYTIHYLGFGVRGTWFRRGTYRDGLYLAPQLTYVDAGVKVRDRYAQTTEYDASGLMLGGLVGYGWFWDSFNVMAGAGLDMTLGPQQIRVRDSSGRTGSLRATLTGPALEISLGFTF